MSLINLLDLHSGLPLEDVPRFFENDLGVLCKSYLVTQVLDDRKDEVVNLERCILPVVNEGQNVLADGFELLNQTLND